MSPSSPPTAPARRFALALRVAITALTASGALLVVAALRGTLFLG